MLARRLLIAGGSGSFVAPAVYVVTAQPDGGWPSNVRPATYYNGHTFFGYTDNSGNIEIRTVTNATHAVSAETLIGGPTSEDWHNAPAVLVRDSDKRLLAALCSHDSPDMYVRLSTNPEDSSAWGSSTDIDSSLGGSDYTYPVLYQMLDEAAQPIYLFYRNQASTTSQLAYGKSTDGGATWSAQTVIYENSGKSTYWVVSKADNSRLDYLVTDGTTGDSASVYHFYSTGGSYHKSDGTLISSSLPLAPSDLTLVYNGSTNGARFIASCAKVGSEIAGTFVVHHGSDEDYIYVRWNGSTWSTHTVLASVLAGGTYPWIEGGLVVDPANLGHMALSALASGTWRMFDYTTADSGATWASTRLTSTGDDDIYPFFIRDYDTGLRYAWLKGTATSFTSFDFGIYGYGV